MSAFVAYCQLPQSKHDIDFTQTLDGLCGVYSGETEHVDPSVDPVLEQTLTHLERLDDEQTIRDLESIVISILFTDHFDRWELHL